MSLLTDNKMHKYVHKQTGREVVMMSSLPEVGEFVRKDLAGRIPVKQVIIVEPAKPAVVEKV